jgi:peptide/nickel transport system ATP-binding protein
MNQAHDPLLTTPVIRADDLCIDYRLGKTWLNAVREVSLAIHPMQIHGLVGESGSGKSTLALALMRYMSSNARISSGTLTFEGVDLLSYSEAQMRSIWGHRIALVPQDALASLNPSYTVGNQMGELLQRHTDRSPAQAQAYAVEMLRQVKIADPELVARRYPHQLSGGMMQRVMIAMALSTQPRLLILDEPTTALDVTTQAVILDLFRELVRDPSITAGAGALYVSHDLGTVAQLCDHVTVLYAGEVMESAPVADLYVRPLHPYTVGLLASLPRPIEGQETRLSTIEGVAPSLADRPHACVFSTRCPAALDLCRAEKPPLENISAGRMVRCWRWREIESGELSLGLSPVTRSPQPIAEAQAATDEITAHPTRVLNVRGITKHFGQRTWIDRALRRKFRPIRAVDDVDLSVNVQSTLGVVGESGSGKTTLARCIVALETADKGEIELCGIDISRDLSQRPRDVLRNLRMVFQNPESALNPYHTIGQALKRPLRLLGQRDGRALELDQRVAELLESVRLPTEYAGRYPGELSGGEKQRVAIARAFAAQPALIVADEPTSSLDVSVQAVVLNLLKDLRRTNGVSYVLISHDLDVISYLADWIVVMYLGQIVEQGTTQDVYGAPSHPYTEALVSAHPVADPQVRGKPIRLDGEVPSARDLPTGCRFHTRCPRKIGPICQQQEPPWQDAGNRHFIRCHIPIDELAALQTDGEAHKA